MHLHISAAETIVWPQCRRYGPTYQHERRQRTQKVGTLVLWGTRFDDGRRLSISSFSCPNEHHIRYAHFWNW